MEPQISEPLPAPQPQAQLENTIVIKQGEIACLASRDPEKSLNDVVAEYLVTNYNIPEDQARKFADFYKPTLGVYAFPKPPSTRKLAF